MRYAKVSLIISCLFVATSGGAQEQEQSVTTEVVQESVQSQAPAATTAPVVTQEVVAPKAVKTKPVQAEPAVTTQEIVVQTKSMSEPAPSAPVASQPVTVVEASPLRESKAERMRKSRQDAEVQTEQKIVEELERSRLEDEAKRADRLFNNGNNSGDGKTGEAVAAPASAPAAQTPTATPAPVVAPAPVTTETSDAEAADDVSASEPKNKIYLAPMIGISNYPNADNVRGNIAGGVGVGMKFPSSIQVEGTFLYSQYDLEKVSQYSQGYYYSWAAYPEFVDVSQWGVQAAIKYAFLPDAPVHPIVGGILGYTHRSYTNQYYYNYDLSGDSGNSNAFDGGLLLGTDVDLSPTFSVGVDFRYMFNLSYTTSGQPRSILYPDAYYGTPLEEIDYYLVNLAAKITF